MNFTVYKSSAGSGKTFTLVKEYLSIVLKNPANFKLILAITFTNKAAAEMKSRVLQSLELLAEYDSLNDKRKSKIKDMYTALINKGLNHNEIVRNSQITISNIIHYYNYFSIGTIDSFTHKIVKTFAFDLKMPLKFDVELDKQSLINQAVELLISNIGNDHDLTKFMLKFANSFVEDETKADIKNRLIKLAEILFDEDSQEYLKTLQNLNFNDFSKIIDEISNKKKNIENNIANYAKDCLELISSANIDINSFYQKKSGLGEYLKKISTKKINKPNSYVKETLEADKWYSNATPENEKANIDSIKNQLQEKAAYVVSYIYNNYDNYIFIEETLKNIYSLSLLNELKKILVQISHYDNVVHISEFAKSINEIINNEPIPFIYERIGERYKHFLIDEFQDTSVLQWQNLLPLIDNSLSENNFNMIVGDGKQAIYRFRNGEVEQFALLPHIYRKEEFKYINDRENSLIRNYKEENLITNYRSKSKIVEFNNLFFEFMVKNLNLDFITKVYNNHYQEFRPSNEGGGVLINFIDYQNKNKYWDCTFEEILKCIEKQISDGFQYKDITILCLSNSQAYYIANYLNDKSVKVISGDSLLLIASSKVRLIVALLKYMINSFDAINNANIIQLFYEIFHENNNDDFGNNILEISKNNNIFNLDDFFKKFNFDFKNLNLSVLSLYELCEKLITILNFDKEPNPYLMFFMDAVYNYSVKRNNTSEDFINWWDDKKNNLSLKNSSSINAVTVMTIHKSKGLEFPVVIYPFADQTPKKTKKYVWVKVNEDISTNLPYSLISLTKKTDEIESLPYYKEESDKSKLDLLNAVYVALTRASERLFIFTRNFDKIEDSKNNNSSFNLSKMLKKFAENAKIDKIDDKIYCFGNFSSKSETLESKNLLSLELKSYAADSINKKMNISKISPDYWNAQNPEMYRNFGSNIHEILAKSDSSDEIPKLIDSYVNSGKINITEKNNYADILSKLFHNPTFQSIVKSSIFDIKEAEIIQPDGKVIRPDRIIGNNENTYIIDYKTGNKSPNHIKQLENYKKAVIEMGYKNVKLLLVYIKDEPEVEIW